MTKKDLALQLSRLQGFETPSASLEQYATTSELAAQLLWDAYMQGDITGKVIADFGCGPGIFGLGALLLEAKKVFFVDIDKSAIALAKKNLQLLEQMTGSTYSASFLSTSVAAFDHKVDVVLQNPPFGVQLEHADKLFLEKAMRVGNVVYSLHKIESTSFIKALAEDHGFTVTHLQKVDFPLPKTQKFHTQKIHAVPVGIWRLERL